MFQDQSLLNSTWSTLTVYSLQVYYTGTSDWLLAVFDVAGTINILTIANTNGVYIITHNKPLIESTGILGKLWPE